MSVNSVIVRMYRKLLGDCFLIVVENDGKYSKTLVDCGILQGTPGGDARMRSVVENVYQSFGKELDLIVVTHEHWDHISGFQYASKLFAKHRFKNLWMAWTEDPADPDGQALQEKFSNAHVKLTSLAMVTGRPLRAESSMVGLMGFAGPLSADKKKGAKRGSEAIYENLRQRTEMGPQYLSPGMTEDLPGGLKTYVLAPPRNQKLLFKALPSRGDAQETYLGAAANEDEFQQAQAQSPFSPRYRWRSYWEIKRQTTKASDAEMWVRDRYFGADIASGRGDDDFDRRIDDRYDLEFNRLAIRMDSNTNNSSLVLAIELPDRSTMIFAADAQVGNWLSWGGVEFKEDVAGAEQLIKGHDLLARARLYKVGHHGSHNATLKKEGLELMVRDDLIALISTDAKFALEQGKGWLMPNPNVSAALEERTHGRVVRGDKLTSAEHAALADRVRESKDELYVDVLTYGDWPVDYQLQTGAT
jgi:beta-lactamase superfamily II metal-dependent hydrolase